jgi:predicted ATP-binding protein involved in virulence
MSEYVTNISALGLHGRLDLHHEFRNGVNILYGRNGTGKTTLLHILSNVLNSDYERFLHLGFDKIEVILSGGTVVRLLRQRDERRIRVLVTTTIDGVKTETTVRPEDYETFRRVVDRSGRYREVRFRSELESAPESKPPILPAAYFPAFRTMMEAWTSMEEERAATNLSQEELSAKATVFARKLFGSFVPRIIYPSALDIEQRLGSEIKAASFNVARSDEELLAESFVQIFAALRKRTDAPPTPPEQILDEIRAFYEQSSETSHPGVRHSVYARLQTMLGTLKFTDTPEITAVRILEVFRDALAKRARIQDESFRILDTYLQSVNEFLDGKRLEKKFTPKIADSHVTLQFDDGRATSLRALSSGERQIVTLIYAATHMNEQQVVLIDEPELSLHVDWQRKLLSRMSSQLGDRQIIACTHSPVIGADYEERRTQIGPDIREPDIAPEQAESEAG